MKLVLIKAFSNCSPCNFSSEKKTVSLCSEMNYGLRYLRRSIWRSQRHLFSPLQFHINLADEKGDKVNRTMKPSNVDWTGPESHTASNGNVSGIELRLMNLICAHKENCEWIWIMVGWPKGQERSWWDDFCSCYAIEEVLLMVLIDLIWYEFKNEFHGKFLEDLFTKVRISIKLYFLTIFFKIPKNM